MKNIHVLPTDKPSRLGQVYEKLSFFKDRTWDNTENWRCKNIYITNDEEIKEGDWFYDLDTKYIKIKQSWENSHLDFNGKKIILTTDPDLIKDGVQAIDDDFLEWFVKNPSCEEVHVYNQTQVGYEYDEYHFILPEYNTKQETPEEAAERFYPIPKGGSMWMPSRDDLNKANKQEGFIEGTKWQAERMYSEEEVFNLCREFAIFVQRNGPSYKKQQEWFEQFKKK
jgi:hypothetical protein